MPGSFPLLPVASELRNSCQHLAKTAGCRDYIAENIVRFIRPRPLGGRNLVGMCWPENASTPMNEVLRLYIIMPSVLQARVIRSTVVQ